MKRLALSLGVFSVGLGLAEVVAPRALGKFLGTKKRAMIRGFGVREIAAGMGIFARPSRPEPLWARVAGDVVDLAALTACSIESKKKRNVAVALGSVTAVTALDVVAARKAA